MSKFDEEKYNNAKKVGEAFFDKNKKINSLSLGSVRFNSDGFLHLVYKNKKHKRDWKNQVKRFHLLKYVKPILEKMGYYQEYQERVEEVMIKDHGMPKRVTKVLKYWAFVAIVDNKIRIKVILRKVGDGEIIFWSVIPYWKTSEYKDIKLTTLHKGDLSID